MTRRSSDSVSRAIVEVRGKRVILAVDLARIYGVETRALNQAVKRNRRRFPVDFAFRLTSQEASDIGRSRSQNVILKRGENVKYRPVAFTEHGAIMAATVLNSARAIHMSVFVVRAFLRLREWAADQAELSARLLELERRVGEHDREIGLIIGAIRKLVAPRASVGRKIGFAPLPRPGREAASVTNRGEPRRDQCVTRDMRAASRRRRR